jgi:hypothetical protein
MLKLMTRMGGGGARSAGERAVSTAPHPTTQHMQTINSKTAIAAPAYQQRRRIEASLRSAIETPEQKNASPDA